MGIQINAAQRLLAAASGIMLRVADKSGKFHDIRKVSKTESEDSKAMEKLAKDFCLKNKLVYRNWGLNHL
jgi:hypothetical protein